MMNALKSPKYHDLRDREAHPAESPEENNSLMTDHDGEVEKAWSDDTARDHPAMVSLRKSRRQKIKSAVMSFRSILDTVLLLVILALVVDRRWGASTRLEFAGDLTGFAPRFSQQIKKFAPDHDFVPENATDFFSTRTLRKWLGTVPVGLGYLRINNTKDYDNLPTPLEGYPDYTFTTSMTHQLHCLHAIAGVVAALSLNNTSLLPDAEKPWHVAHCIDYIRQSIMCCGDVALEGQQTTFPEGLLGSDGWDAKHVCKDYGQVISWMNEKRTNDEVWI